MNEAGKCAAYSGECGEWCGFIPGNQSQIHTHVHTPSPSLSHAHTGADYVVESTGIFLSEEAAGVHLKGTHTPIHAARASARA